MVRCLFNCIISERPQKITYIKHDLKVRLPLTWRTQKTFEWWPFWGIPRFDHSVNHSIRHDYDFFFFFSSTIMIYFGPIMIFVARSLLRGIADFHLVQRLTRFSLSLGSLSLGNFVHFHLVTFTFTWFTFTWFTFTWLLSLGPEAHKVWCVYLHLKVSQAEAHKVLQERTILVRKLLLMFSTKRSPFGFGGRVWLLEETLHFLRGGSAASIFGPWLVF